MGQNNDTTEHSDLQGQQGATAGEPRSSYLSDVPKQEPFQTGIPLKDGINLANRRYNARDFASKHAISTDIAEKILRLYGPNWETCDRAAKDLRR